MEQRISMEYQVPPQVHDGIVVDREDSFTKRGSFLQLIIIQSSLKEEPQKGCFCFKLKVRS